MGELFQYTVGNVTLARQKSAMLPIITDSVEIERVSIYNAAVLEELARMAFVTRTLNPGAARLPERLIRKHFERKHGKHAYYGQEKSEARATGVARARNS